MDEYAVEYAASLDVCLYNAHRIVYPVVPNLRGTNSSFELF